MASFSPSLSNITAADNDGTKLSPMKEFYKGKTVFLTGGTGFLGQLYVEKLLRCDVKHIYVLARAKRGVNPEQRLKETFCGTHFSKCYFHDKDYWKRITVIEGDMGMLKIGISDENRQSLIDNVEIVIHAAADVRFDEKLRKLLLTNLRGTREMLDLASQMKNIKAFTFISTAYSQCIRNVVEEKFYDAPVDPYAMIKIGELYSDSPNEELEILTERIIKPWPNTYTYTKSLTEDLVRRYGSKFPVCIIRPSIVMSTHEEPIPAWSNNIYGINGCLVAAGLGILRVVPMNLSNVGDIVCADYVINGTLTALWATHDDFVKNQNSHDLKEKDPEIYHICTSTDVPLTWSTIMKSMHDIFEEYPAESVLWRQCTNIVTSEFMLRYYTIWYHVLPAIISDIGLKIAGKSLRVLPSYRKVQRFMTVLSFFMLSKLRFDTTNMKRIIERMTPEDYEFFRCDVRRFEWSKFTYNYLCGLKVYIAQESLDSIDKARRKYTILKILHYIVLVFYYGIHLYILSFLCDKLGLFSYLRNCLYDTYEFLKNPQMDM